MGARRLGARQVQGLPSRRELADRLKGLFHIGLGARQHRQHVDEHDKERSGPGELARPAGRERYQSLQGSRRSADDEAGTDRAHNINPMTRVLRRMTRGRSDRDIDADSRSRVRGRIWVG